MINRISLKNSQKCDFLLYKEDVKLSNDNI